MDELIHGIYSLAVVERPWPEALNIYQTYLKLIMVILFYCFVPDVDPASKYVGLITHVCVII